MTLSSAAVREVTSLENMGLDELRDVWQSHWGPPPPLRSPGLLRLTIAWRLQAEGLGGLDRNTRRALASQSASPADGLNLGEGGLYKPQAVAPKQKRVRTRPLGNGLRYVRILTIWRGL
jgi:hypothetical protein